MWVTRSVSSSKVFSDRSVYVRDNKRARGRFSGDEQDLERSQRVRIEHHRTDVDVVTVDESQAASARISDDRFLAVNVHRRESGWGDVGYDGWRRVGREPGLLQDKYAESAVTNNAMQVRGFVYGRMDIERAVLQVVDAYTFAFAGRGKTRIRINTPT